MVGRKEERTRGFACSLIVVSRIVTCEVWGCGSEAHAWKGKGGVWWSWRCGRCNAMTSALITEALSDAHRRLAAGMKRWVGLSEDGTLCFSNQLRGSPDVLGSALCCSPPEPPPYRNGVERRERRSRQRLSAQAARATKLSGDMKLHDHVHSRPLTAL